MIFDFFILINFFVLQGCKKEAKYSESKSIQENFWSAFKKNFKALLFLIKGKYSFAHKMNKMNLNKNSL